MIYGLEQTRRFARAYKKLHGNAAADVDAATEIIAADPHAGAQKKGDLASLFVYRFYSQKHLYLLGYTVDDAIRLIYLEANGLHENFYRDLKRY